jgi:hypothetical protein
MTANIIGHWTAHPIIVVIEDAYYPISSVEFPSVTICSAVKGTPQKLVYEMCRLKLYTMVPEEETSTISSYFFDLVQYTYANNVYDPRFYEMGMTKKDIDLFLRNVISLLTFVSCLFIVLSAVMLVYCLFVLFVYFFVSCLFTISDQPRMLFNAQWMLLGW